MKTTVSFIVLMTGLILNAQPVFETTLSESANICTLESAGDFFYSMDVINRQCNIYGMDFTVYKTIPLPVPDGYYLVDVRHVSEKIFNEDELIELVYIYSKFVSTADSYYYTYEAKLINENGSELLTIPGAGYTEVLETGSHGRKFLVFEYDYSLIPWRTYTHVYGLPENSVKSGSAILHETGYSLAYPNPASGLVNIPIDLPDGIQSGTLEITGTGGNILLRIPVTASDTRVVLPVQNLEPGTCIYSLRSGNRQLSSGKLVVGR